MLQKTRRRQFAIKNATRRMRRLSSGLWIILGEAAVARPRMREITTRNVTSTLKSCRIGLAFPFVSDTENFAAPGVTPYSWEGGNRIFNSSFIQRDRKRLLDINDNNQKTYVRLIESLTSGRAISYFKNFKNGFLLYVISFYLDSYLFKILFWSVFGQYIETPIIKCFMQLKNFIINCLSYFLNKNYG